MVICFQLDISSIVSGEVVIAKSSPSLSSAIHQAYESLSKNERLIADLVLESPGQVCLLSASELANAAGVSNSTVTRFVHRTGFDSYEHMRQLARESRRWGSPLFMAPATAPLDNEQGDLIQRFLQHEKAVLKDSLNSLSLEQLDEITTALLDARNLGFMGFRNSHYFASYARWQFIQFRERTRLIPGPGETVAERIADLGPEDVVVVVGIRRIVGKLKRYLETLSDSGVRVLLLTDPSARVTPAYARWTITCPVDTPHVFDCYAGVLAVIRLLAYETFMKSGSSGRKYLENIEIRHERLGEFE